jgi:hypothetical protein
MKTEYNEYNADEFIGTESTECPKDEIIDKKVSLLCDLCVLIGTKKHDDDREEAVRRLLASYGTEQQIDNAIHPIIVGNCTLNQTLKRKGYM